MDKEQMKIKLFVLKADEFEKQVNDWLLQHPNIEMMVDGGINEDTIEFVKIADIVVSGSYITKSKNYQDQIDKLRQKKKNRDHLDIPKRMES